MIIDQLDKKLIFLIKSVRIEPCVVECKNRFIFENKVTFDVLLLDTAKIYWFDLKRCLANLNSTFLSHKLLYYQKIIIVYFIRK